MTTTEPGVIWHGCYDDRWNDLIVPDAFAHPAKMARGLVAKIFDELFTTGALRRGDVVVDPFGGIGTTAIEGASRGVQVICCELEPKFVALALDNFALHRRDWQAMGRPLPTVVLGDSRELRNVMAMSAAMDAVISSPPYAEIASGAGGLNTTPPKHAGQQAGRSAASASQDTDQRYGDSAGQLARMALGAIVSSPPYEGTPILDAPPASGGIGNQYRLGNRGKDAAKHADGSRAEGYGSAPGQLGNLPSGQVDAVVSSPPFTQGYAGGGGINVKGYGPDGADKVGSRTYQGTGNDRAEGNLETLTLGEVDAVVSSPPYSGEAVRPSGVDSSKFAPGVKSGGPNSQAVNAGYGDTEGQLGCLRSDETFWSAAKQIVAESFAILRPGGTAVWVVKAFVRDKQLVDFPGDWRRLCEHVGFETFREVHASLVHEEVRSHLFDGEVVKRRERKSFFRRLAEKKGSPRIDFEVVLFMRKLERTT